MAPVQPVAAPPPPPQAKRQTAVIGSSMHIKGEIRTDEELLVDGEVEGALESRSVLTIGANGKVRANIKARDVVIFGSVRGNVEATEKLAIRDKGHLVGDIKTTGISIDDGAYFKGSIDISRPEPKDVSKPAESKPETKVNAKAG
jgi:cytoskeletal protein CcmA (bactofilin family)